MRVLQIGNQAPPHSTESHLRTAMLSHGWDVRSVQENDRWCWSDLAANAPADVDFVLWTRTGWDYDHLLGPGGDKMVKAWQHQFLRLCRLHGIPTVGYHLDVWRRLEREHQVEEEPFFSCSLLVTADGSDEQWWMDKGVNHVWFLPGVSEPECAPGTPRDEFRSKIAFVGSWQGHYHQEHQHRFELVDWLRRNFKRDCAFWPRQGQPAVRGQDLRDLYASVDVLVGDSCFSGDGIGKYCSDRLPESLGRGGFLIHPDTPGVTDDSLTPVGEAWQTGVHLMTWQAGNWDELGVWIDWALSTPKEVDEIRQAGKAFTVANHTYEVRVRQVAELLQKRGMLP